jgi:hypothetical protein
MGNKSTTIARVTVRKIAKLTARPKEPEDRPLGDAHFFRCRRVDRGWFSYEVRRGDERLSRRLFSTRCRATDVDDVAEHAGEELRLYLARERASKAPPATEPALTRSHPLLTEDLRAEAALYLAEPGRCMLDYAKRRLDVTSTEVVELRGQDPEDLEGLGASVEAQADQRAAAILYVYEAAESVLTPATAAIVRDALVDLQRRLP